MKKLFTLLLLAISLLANSQAFTGISIKVGTGIAGQIKTPKKYGDGGSKVSLNFTIEPTLFTFGAKKQFDLNTDISFIQKGGVNHSPIYSYNSFGEILGTGGESYIVAMNYLCISPTVKMKFGKLFFAKFGPRMDALLYYNAKDRFASDTRTSKDFSKLNYGITYGAGLCTGTKKVKFIAELIGQNDFSQSSYNNASRQSYVNFCYYVNCGVNIVLNKKDE